VTSTIFFQVEIIRPHSWCNFVVVGAKPVRVLLLLFLGCGGSFFVAMIDRDNL
jgi:hypothetical protein